MYGFGHLTHFLSNKSRNNKYTLRSLSLCVLYLYTV